MERHNFSSVEQVFNNLIKEFEKSKKVIDESGIPNFFIRSIYRLEDKIKNFSPEDEIQIGRLATATEYRVVPFSKALDTIEIKKLIQAEV